MGSIDLEMCGLRVVWCQAVNHGDWVSGTTLAEMAPLNFLPNFAPWQAALVIRHPKQDVYEANP